MASQPPLSTKRDVQLSGQPSPSRSCRQSVHNHELGPQSKHGQTWRATFNSSMTSLSVLDFAAAFRSAARAAAAAFRATAFSRAACFRWSCDFCCDALISGGAGGLSPTADSAPTSERWKLSSSSPRTPAASSLASWSSCKGDPRRGSGGEKPMQCQACMTDLLDGRYWHLLGADRLHSTCSGQHQ